MRKLIVNADDFGLTEGVTRGIVETFERGIVTSASLMVRYPAAAQAASYARIHPELSVGLHFDIAEWLYRGGEWQPRYQVVAASDASALQAEVARQLAAFRALVGRDPTHIDSHQHVHLREPLRSILTEVAGRLGVPMRGCTHSIHHCGAFYGLSEDASIIPLTLAMFTRITNELPPGISEMGCHPGFIDDLESDYREPRVQEMAVLCNSAVRRQLGAQDIELVSFCSFSGPGT